jgi:hypothetical protein
MNENVDERPNRQRALRKEDGEFEFALNYKEGKLGGRGDDVDIPMVDGIALELNL